jgi:tetratricopeptide (TPR) repeat protein
MSMSTKSPPKCLSENSLDPIGRRVAVTLGAACFAALSFVSGAVLGRPQAKESRLDRVVLTSGLVHRGSVVDSGDNSIRIEVGSGAARVHKRDIASISFDEERRLDRRLETDRVEFKDGHFVEGDVEVIDGGKRVRVLLAGKGGAEDARPSIVCSMAEVFRIRRRSELMSDSRYFTVELGERIRRSIGELASADSTMADGAEAFLRQCGIFSSALIEAELTRERSREGTERREAVIERLERLSHANELRRLVTDEIQDFAPDIYDILALGSPDHAKRELLKLVLPHFAGESSELAMFIVRNPRESSETRALTIDLLRRLNDHETLLNLYNSSRGEIQLAAAIALARNRVLFGVPTLLEALDLESVDLRALAEKTLREATGEDFRFRADGAPAARAAAITRWEAWWERNRAALEQNSLAILRGGGEETEETRLATTRWKEAHRAWAASKPEEAVRLFRSALEADPNFVKAHIGLAVLYYSTLEKPDEAEKILRSLVERPLSSTTPRDRYWIRYELGNALVRAGRRLDAIDQFEECISLDPAEVLAYEARADAIWHVATREKASDENAQRARLEEVAADYAKALELRQKSLEGLGVLDADSLPEAESLPFARRLYNRNVLATRMGYEQEVVRLQRSIARVRHLLGDHEAAARSIREAIEFLYVTSEENERAPLEIELRNYLGFLYERLGNDREALEEYQRVLKRLDAENAVSRRGIDRVRRRATDDSADIGAKRG